MEKEQCPLDLCKSPISFHYIELNINHNGMHHFVLIKMDWTILLAEL